MSLKSVFNKMVVADQEKIASARAAAGLPPPPPDVSQFDPALMKQAQDYDEIGRILARNVFSDLLQEELDKTAMPVPQKKAMHENMMAVATGKKKRAAAPPTGHAPDHEAKVAAAKKKILARMAKDPGYVSKLVAKHQRA
jgi:hypothetical protein